MLPLTSKILQEIFTIICNVLQSSKLIIVVLPDYGNM